MERELRWFKLAQEKCSIFPQGAPTQSAPPAPDICFCAEDLGIEMMEYLLGQGKTGSALRNLERSHERIVKDAQAAFEALRSEKVHVGVFWISDGDVDKTTRQMLVAGIARVVRNLLSYKQDIWRPDWTRPEEADIGMHIGQIGLLPTRESYWGCDEAGMAGGDVKRVQAAIAEKEPKVDRYRRACCQTLWLLIVACGHHISSTFSPDENFDDATFYTRFDRVFLLDEFRCQVRELRVADL